MNYTYTFGGTVTVTANTEEEAYSLAETFVAVTPYQADNGVSVDELQLVDVTED